LRLDPTFRWAVYGAIAVLFMTGILWLIADQLKESASGEAWQQLAANVLMVHGGTAMVTLMLLGALVPLHILRGWRARKNRVTGTAMASLNGVLIATAFGLYYLGSETFRPWASGLHIGFGVALPVLGVAHILMGRRVRSR
jgi:hypothetical protein